MVDRPSAADAEAQAGGAMTFVRPWLLLAIVPLLALVWGIAVAGRPAVPRRQHRWALWTRVLATVLLVAALAAPLVSLGATDRAVLFLVDRSASISADGAAAADAYIAAALDAGAPVHRSGVAVFARSAVVDAPLAQGRQPAVIRAEVDASATDIASALRSAASLLPSEGSRRIVLISDGIPTMGDTRAAAEEMAALGIAVDIVDLGSGRGRDAAIDGVFAPATARVGDEVTVEVTVVSNVDTEATLTVSIGDAVEQRDVHLDAGRNVFEFAAVVSATGVVEVEATVDAGDDVEQNDTGRAVVRVLDAASIAIVEGRSGEAAELGDALQSAGYDVSVFGAVPGADDLIAYDAVVLVNVPAPAADVTEALADFVEVLGRGLVVVGGDQAYGLGDYSRTALEELLPVRSDPDDLVRRQPVAEVILIDTSGSMGQCHCRDGEFVEGGVNKTDISRAGAQLAIEALAPSDRVGVLAFGSGTDWVLPLAERPSDAEVESALGSLFPDGNTAIARGLRAALDELRDAPEQLRHIVLFTDGWDPNEVELLPAAREVSEAGVTLSVLGTGEGPGTTLRRMAELGGGRYYHGADLEEIPEIFVEETLTVARNLAQEGSFLPLLNGVTAVTEHLTAAPPLGGYVLTKPKVAAIVPLLLGSDEDPLLATWRRGLGKVTAWTSDATSRWAVDWTGWDGYASFWSAVVADVIPSDRETAPEVTVTGTSLGIRFAPGAVPDDAGATAAVRGPDGETIRIPLRRTGISTFEGEAPVTAEGSYWVAATVESQGTVVASGTAAGVAGYPSEFAFRQPDPTLIADVTELTSGRVDPEPGAVFDAAPVSGKASASLWPWLAAAALVFFLVDVGLRRLLLVRAATSPARDVASPPDGDVVIEERAEEKEEPGASSATIGRLLDRKRR
jgi:uncharacterized membrane protein